MPGYEVLIRSIEMDERLIDKLKRVIDQHNQETGEKVNHVSVRWLNQIGYKSSVEKIEVTIEK